MIWEMKPLSEVAELCLGKMLDKRKNRGNLRPYLANINVRWGKFDLDNLRTMKFEDKELDRYSLKLHDIVMCEGGEPGRCAIWKCQTERMMIQKALHRIRPTKELNPFFLFYVFLLKGNLDQFSNYFTGATIKHLPSEKLAKVEVPVPPLPVQEKISSVLKSFDDLIEINEKKLKVLEEMARRIYREWFVDFKFPNNEKVKMVDSGHPDFGMIPEGWEVKPLSTYAGIQRGKSYKSSELVEDGGINFVNLKCFQRGGGFRQSGLKRFEGSIKETQLLETGDIVVAVTDMTQDRAIVGRAARIPEGLTGQTTYSMDVVKIIPTQLNERAWTYSTLRYSGMANEIKNYANGANVLHLKPQHIIDFPVVRASQDLIRQFSSIINPLFEQHDALNLMNDKLIKMRNLLLPTLINGEVDASVLDIDGDQEIVDRAVVKKSIEPEIDQASAGGSN